MESLDKVRKKITQLDEQLVSLIRQRIDLTNSIIEVKLKSGKSLIDYDREEIVLKRVEAVAKELNLDTSIIRKIYADIIFLSRNNQIDQFAEAHPTGEKVTIGFQGEIGAYSHLALSDHYPRVEPVPCDNFREVFDALELNKVDGILVPVENSVEGTVRPVYDLLLDRDVTAYQEVIQKVEHMLIGTTGYKIDTVYSHPQALGQCSTYITNQKLKAIPVSDTAGAVRFIKEEKMVNAAAIASHKAAEIHGLEILERNIENNSDNFTRFFLVSRTEKRDKILQIIDMDPSKKYKTSLIFGVHDRSGSLLEVLEAIANSKINMTKLESRPSRKRPWDYTFYVDIEGHREDRFVQQMLDEINEKTTFLQIIGSYSSIH